MPEGEMVGAGNDERCTGSHEFDKHRLRIHSAAIIDDDNAQILEGQRCFWHLGPLDDQLPVRDREARTGGTDFNRFTDHRKRQSCAGRMRPMGSIESFCPDIFSSELGFGLVVVCPFASRSSSSTICPPAQTPFTTQRLICSPSPV